MIEEGEGKKGRVSPSLKKLDLCKFRLGRTKEAVVLGPWREGKCRDRIKGAKFTGRKVGKGPRKVEGGAFWL